MSFYKKVVVLKELEKGFSLSNKKISGIARVEIESGVCELHLSLINVSSANNGEFMLFFVDADKTIFCFPLGIRPFAHALIFNDIPHVEKGFSIGLCFVKDDLPVTIAFSATEDSPVSLTDFKKLVADKCLELRRKKERERMEKSSPAPCEEQPPIPKDLSTTPYDDEAVATENFYALSEQINDRLQLFKETEDARLRNENAMSNERCQEKAQESEHTTDCVQDETNASFCKENNGRVYYDTVRAELDGVFEKFPPDEKLNAFFAESKWARVRYAENKYYVVGLVKENGVEKYICYGVPAKYSPEPPKELLGYASFIPLSVFDLQGDGYWMMFQDAVNGKCIKLVKND